MCFMLPVLLVVLFVGSSNACTKIIVESSDKDLNWIDGTFIMDPTLVSDGRPVYVEVLDNEQEQHNTDIMKRSLYHYSHEILDELEQYEEKDFIGRWILGNSMYSSNGWTYLKSWAISPAQNMINALVNTTINNNDREFHVETDTINPKIQWQIYLDNEWKFDTKGLISFQCDSNFDDITQDWLFVSTPNHYQMNILNKHNRNSPQLNSITDTNLHGFYYRISSQYWRKIESKIFLHKTTNSSSFFYYNNYTNTDGTPNMDLFNGYKIVTHFNSNENENKFDAMNDNEWIIMDENNTQYKNKTLTIKFITISDANDDIYSAYRRYWRHIKLDSFNKVVDKLNVNELQKDKLLVDMNNNLPFLMLGLGSGGLTEINTKQSMQWAFNEIGYRLIDGAQAYENEHALGQYLSASDTSINRDELFITSKVWPTHLGFIQTYKAILDSLNKVQTNYFDLYMIHWNRCNPDISWMHCQDASNRPWGQSYQIMEKLYAEGYLLSLGVSNYNFNTFNEIVDSHNMQIIPQVIQNYFDMSHADWELAQYVQKYGVIYQGYAHFRGIAQAEDRMKNGETHYKIFKDKLRDISIRLTQGKAAESQIILRWLIEKNIAVIPRSSSYTHLKQNWNIWDFDLNDNDISELTQLSIDQNMRQQKGEL